MSSSAASLRSGLTIALGRAARLAARLRGGGSGGTALPGLVMEKTDPGFLRRTLDQLPLGVVVVSGTNGKTTTTKMVVELLTAQGLKVLTNRTGSNFVRGVLASLLTEVDAVGRLNHDVAVLELDEAHAVRFVRRVRPRAALLLNVMRDQLDRFGEIDYTASLLHKVAVATTDAVVVNADDPRLSGPAFFKGVRARTAAFGAGSGLRSLFVSDDDLRTGSAAPAETPADGAADETAAGGADMTGGGAPADGAATTGGAPADGAATTGGAPTAAAETPDAPAAPPTADAPAADAPAADAPAPVATPRACPAPRVVLESLQGRGAVVRVDGTDHEVSFAIPGVHNQLNACAALALALEVLGEKADVDSLLAALARVRAAFGRGEVLTLDGRDVELSLVKNPAGFRMGLLTAEQAVAARGAETVMIAINDEYADGRDMSWLWDVDFTCLRGEGVAVVTGVRAWDMALRLRYDEVPIGVVEPDLGKALALLRRAPDVVTGAGADKSAGANAGAGEEAAAADGADKDAGASAGADKDAAAETGTAPSNRPMRVFTTYTAMLALRARLGELTEVEEVMK
ncbi:MurT ligase domain-containing protein [uncultured Actinomyces sp.]|uniref:MurT ligase domain-containing protein n=1 Tax=uncultured Actinomyces sp. TaxID=249061 RepID=UPI00288A3166|nr:MurT ligase domain-containing protein [uncultured Actinomyces sp.]